MKKNLRASAIAVLMILFHFNSWGQINLTTSITQNFDGLGITPQSWTDNSTVSGLYVAFNSGTTLNSDAGTGTSGNAYNYGTVSATDRALGGLSSSGYTSRIGVRIKNTTGNTITSLTISYNGEQWRQTATASPLLSFDYLIGTTVSSITTGTYTANTNLDFAGPKTGTAGSLDGNAAANRVAVTYTLTGISIPNNSEIMLRWSKTGTTSAAMAVDDLVVTASNVNISSPAQVAAQYIYQNTSNNVISAFQVANTTGGAITLSAANFTLTGNYTAAADLSVGTPLKLYYTGTSNSFSTTTLVKQIASLATGTGETISLGSFGTNPSIANNATGYFWLTADIKSTATAARTIAVNATASADLTFSAGTKSSSATAGNTQTISAVPTIAIGTLSPSGPYCQGANVTVPFTISGGFFNTGTSFTAQIGTSSFSANLANIGSNTVSSISGTIVAGQLAGGTLYSIRVNSSSPVVNSSTTTFTLNSKPVVTLPSSSVCTNSTITGITINPNTSGTFGLPTPSGSGTMTYNSGTSDYTFAPITTYSGNVAYTYTLNGCTSSAVNITVNTSPDATFTTATSTNNNTTPCISVQNTYGITTQTGMTYMWSVPTGGAPAWSSISGGSTATISVTPGSTSGNVNVTVTSSTCGTASNTKAIVPLAIPGTPVANSNISPQLTNVNPTDFTTTWSAVTGATGYALDVYQTGSSAVYANDDFESTLSGWNNSTDWAASTTSPITATQSLKHNLTSVAGESYIYNQPVTYDVTTGTTVWLMTIKNGAWSPSSGNKFWFFLMSNSLNLNFGSSHVANGYTVGVNMATNNSLISLCKVTGATATDLITSTATWASSNTYSIRVTRTASGVWTLETKSGGGFTGMTTAATAPTDVTYTTSTYSGLDFTFTATRAGLLWLDDYTIVRPSGNGYISPYQNYAISSTSQLVNSGLSPSSTYYYVVRATNACGASGSSNIVTVNTPPANDAPCNAVLLTPGTAGSISCTGTSTAGDTKFATQTINSSCSAITTQNDVWYKFVATATSHTIHVVGNGTFDPVVQAYTASGCPTPTLSLFRSLCVNSYANNNTGGGTDEDLYMTQATVGVTYYVRVFHNATTAPTNTTFTICVKTAPTNNEACNAVAVTPGTAGSTTCTVAALTGDVALSSETLNSSCSSLTTQRDVWYKFIATQTLHVVHVVGNGTFDPAVQAYTVTGCPSPSFSAYGSLCSNSYANANTGGGTSEDLSLDGLTIGSTYYVRIFHNGSTVPANTTFTICIRTGVTNDECAGTTITVGATCANTAGTTIMSSESLGYATGDDDDVWYNFNATSTSTIVALSPAAGFDGVANLRDNTACPGTNIQYRDFYATGGAEVMNVTGLTVGGNYKVRVFSYGTTTANQGNFNICVYNGYTPSANDNVCNATTATLGTNTGTNNSTYGFEVNEPRGFNWTAEVCNSQWFKFIPATNGNYIISASGFANQLAVYTAATCANMLTGGETEIASDENTTTTTGAVCLTGGTTYYIQVNGFLLATGVPTLTITQPSPVISVQPTTPASVCSGNGTRIISVTAAAALAGTLSYQWRLNGIAISNNSIYSGCASNSLTITNPTSANGGSYDVVITEVSGLCSNSTTSNAVTLTVNATCPYTWTGGANTHSWSTAGNWLSGVAPSSAGSNLTVQTTTASNYPQVPANYILGDVVMQNGGELDLNGFTLDVRGDWHGGTVTTNVIGTGAVEMGGSFNKAIDGANSFTTLRVNKNVASVTNNGTVDITTALELKTGTLTNSGSVTLKSNASGTAYLDNFSGGNAGIYAGDITQELYVANQGTHMLGGLVSNLNIATQLTEINPSGSGPIAPNACNSNVIASGSPYGSLMYWNEAAPFTQNCAQEGYTVISTGIAVNGKGYAAIFDATTMTLPMTVSVTGIPNKANPANANPAIALTKTGSTIINTPTPGGTPIYSNNGTPYTTMTKGWNLIANPFNAPWKWSRNGNTSINTTAYKWIANSTNTYYGTYQPVAEGTAIGVGQGIFIQTTAAIPAFAFDASQRQATTTPVFQQNNLSEDLEIVVSGNSYNDVTHVRFNNQSTNAFDNEIDAYKPWGNMNQPTLFTDVNGQMISINTLNSIVNAPNVLMGLYPGTTGSYALNFNNINSFAPTSYIYLEDKLTGGVWVDVRANSTYTFTSNPADAVDRFVLHFTAKAEIATTAQNCNTPGNINITQPGTAQWQYTITNNQSSIINSGVLNQNNPVTVNAPAGTYTLTLVDANNYTVAKNIIVSGTQPMAAVFSSSSSAAQTGDDVTFTNTTTNATTTNWNFGDGSTNDQSPIANHQYTTAGTYVVTLTVTNADGCSSTTTQNITVTEKVVSGLNNITNSKGINIWGNENKVYVDFSKQINVDAEIQIYNVLGQQLVNEKFGKSTIFSKSIANLEAAYVIVRVKNDDEVTTKKVLLFNR